MLHIIKLTVYRAIKLEHSNSEDYCMAKRTNDTHSIQAHLIASSVLFFLSWLRFTYGSFCLCGEDNNNSNSVFYIAQARYWQRFTEFDGSCDSENAKRIISESTKNANKTRKKNNSHCSNSTINDVRTIDFLVFNDELWCVFFCLCFDEFCQLNFSLVYFLF